METQKVYDIIMKQSKPFKLRVNNTLIETITPKLRKKILPPNFDWKKTVGPIEDRSSQAFGLPEFLQCVKRIDAIPIITLSDYWEKISVRIKWKNI